MFVLTKTVEKTTSSHQRQDACCFPFVLAFYLFHHTYIYELLL